MLFELIIFAVAFVLLSAVVNVALMFGLFKLFMSEAFIDWYLDKFFDMTKKVEKSLDDRKEEV